jgi:hypothetical protein
MTMKLLPALILGASLLGCTAEDPAIFIDGFRPPKPAADEIQIVAPAVLGIAPGADVTLCSYVDYRTAEELDIVDYQGFQSSFGSHHVILYAVSNQQAANTHECNEDDMINARYLASGGADTPKGELPDGVVFRIPAKTQLLVQTHWINATDAPIDGQAAFNLKVTAPSPAHQTAQLVTILSTSFVLPRGKGAAVSECVVGESMKVFTLGGHMHRWGVHAKISHTPVDGAPVRVIYETDWSYEYEFNPPRNNYTTENPLVFARGDRLRIDCDYMNDSGHELPFPSEMCATFAYGYPLDREIDCVDQHWPN